ncbi:ketoacyl-ACP synthase III [Myroides marinus]|uniref:ketoacyl-ACP synthase III n=1 Tax=Myroides marinus TaxID=703342 RepID=UPI002575212E|nr:ketoacyl-ACP synthase III [Myroides marinus]MDM1362590.1 ketoacyl-ACP synthase III [Myroides marinus]
MENVYIAGISYYLPQVKLSNEMISKDHPEWSIDKISKKTGIENRFLAEKSETVSDMAVKAAEIFFEEYNIDRSSIDYLLLCTQNPDYTLPTTACIIQEKLGLSKSIGALDFNLGCSGFVYGLGLAKGIVSTKQAKRVLLITADVYSKIINEKDKSNKTLFGDAATVTLVTSEERLTEKTFKILDFCYGTDGSGYDNLIVKNSGTNKYSEQTEDVLDEQGTYVSNDSYLFMDGTKIFNFTSFNVPPMIQDVISKNNMTDEEISYYVFHQANAFMLDFIRKRCKISEEKFYVSMNDTGNTVSSSIPIALKRLFKEKIDVDNVLLCGFGVGLSIGGVIIKKYEN